MSENVAKRLGQGIDGARYKFGYSADSPYFQYFAKDNAQVELLTLYKTTLDYA